MALTKVTRNLLNTSIADNGTGTAITIASDGSVTFSNTISASGYNPTSWDTAYSWGNHASQSYATESYVNTQVSNLVDSAPATLDTLNELAAALGDDPNFATTVSNQIGTKWTQDNTKISNWDTAYGWGNHAAAGYLTSFTESDPTVPSHVKSITSANISNWNTAYGWGDHSVEGYLTSHQDITGKLDKSGGTMTGNITFASAQTFDGRDVSVDGAKLDNIEAGADVTDTANVVAALTAGTNVSIGSDGTISSTDTNTTYSVGDGGLTQKNFTTALKSKLDGIASGAEVNVNADWNASSGDAQILNKPTIPSLSGYATESYVNTQVSNLVDSSPSTLNTLNELAAALGDDANFSTTVSNQIGTKWTQDNTKISNWDTAYGWGNHASAGYLTSFDITTLTDPKYLRSDTADSASGHITFSDSGYSIGNEYHTWKRAYVVNQGNPDELLYRDGNSLPNGGAYRFHAHIDGTGTDQSATAVYWNQNGTWKLNVTYQSGTSSNHPEFIIDGGVPKISIDHTSNYTVQVLGERIELSEGTGTDNKSGFGTDAYLSVNDTTLRFNPSGAGGINTGNLIWHQGNDGSGSGLDADTVDGIQASSFLRSDADDEKTGHLKLRNNAWLWTQYSSAHDEVRINANASGGLDVYNQTDSAFANIQAGSFQISGTGTITGTTFNNWNTAYGWGNHASAGYLTSHQDISGKLNTSAYTASDVLTKIKTVDGSGSGLDADTLDGSHASVFAPKSAPDFTGEVYTDSSQNAWAFRATTGTTNNSSGLWFTGTTARLLLRDSSGTIKTMLAANGTNSENVINNNTIWHAGNDGSGSGLDADLLDGQHGSHYLDYNNFTNTPTIPTNNNQLTNGAGYTTFTANQSLNTSNSPTFNQVITSNNGNGTNFRVGDDAWLGDTNVANTIQITGLQDSTHGYIIFGSSDNTQLGRSGTGALTYGGNTMWHAGNDGSGSGLDADTVDGIQASSFLRSDATDYLNSTMYCRNDIVVETGYRNRGMFGTYDSYKTQHIWSMGTGYRNSSSGTNFGNLYGAAYKHTNNSTGGTMAGGHQLVWCQNGTGYAALGSNIWTSGNVTAYSDIRVKTNIERIPDALNKVSQLNGYTFDRTDRAEDEEPLRQTGVIAQEVLEVLPEAVTGDEDGHYSVAYGNMVGLLIESIKELKAEVDDLKTQLEKK